MATVFEAINQEQVDAIQENINKSRDEYEVRSED